MDLAGGHTEAVLNKVSKPDLVQLILNTEANLRSQIAKLTIEVKDLLAYSKKLEAYLAIVRNVNSKLEDRAVATKRPCLENAQYSRRDILEVVGIPTSIGENVLEQKVCDVFQEIGVDICDHDIRV